MKLNIRIPNYLLPSRHVLYVESENGSIVFTCERIRHVFLSRSPCVHGCSLSAKNKEGLISGLDNYARRVTVARVRSTYIHKDVVHRIRRLDRTDRHDRVIVVSDYQHSGTPLPTRPFQIKGKGSRSCVCVWGEGC